MNIPETEFVQIPAYDWCRAVKAIQEDIEVKERCIDEDVRLGRFPETITAMRLAVSRNKRILDLIGYRE